MENEKELLIQKWITSHDKKMVKKILKHCSVKEFYKRCKEMYRNTKDPFYIRSMKKINLYYYFYSFYFKKREEKTFAKNLKKVQSKADELDKFLATIAKPTESVYIMQYSFYDKTSEHYFSGGAERYACDLANLIKQLGYTPILIQGGVEEDSQPWVKQHDNLTVVGVNSNYDMYYKIIDSLTSPKLTIYSGCVDWTQGKKGHTPSILISHGITWDCPILDANIETLKNFLNIADTFVSVDTNTISWFRSTFARTIKANSIQFEYIPNYVDLKKYSPNMNKEPNKPIKILFPRRCSDERGFWLFADVIPVILDKYSNVEFDIVGFAHTDEISHRISELQNIFPNKITHRVVGADDMPEVYKQADISLIPTLYSEGTSLSCIEAMASGNAVISTNIGGLTNLIINGYNGLLINPNKVELHKAIETLIINKDTREQLSNQALEVAKVFNKLNWDARWLEILKKNLPSEQLSLDNIDKNIQNNAHFNIKGLNLFIKGKNNIIEIDNDAKFLQTTINIDSNNSYIKIGKVKYIRCSTIHIHNGDNQKIVIDDNTSIEGIRIYCCSNESELHIGKNCMIANNVSIWTGDGHTIIDKNTGELINNSKNLVIIGDNTWIAQDAKLLKKAKLPSNSIIGASSIVTRNFEEEFTLIAGNPATVVKNNVTWNRNDPHVYKELKNV